MEVPSALYSSLYRKTIKAFALCIFRLTRGGGGVNSCLSVLKLCIWVLRGKFLKVSLHLVLYAYIQRKILNVTLICSLLMWSILVSYYDDHSKCSNSISPNFMQEEAKDILHLRGKKLNVSHYDPCICEEDNKSTISIRCVFLEEDAKSTIWVIDANTKEETIRASCRLLDIWKNKMR